jgi:hypothetical protein
VVLRINAQHKKGTPSASLPWNQSDVTVTGQTVTQLSLAWDITGDHVYNDGRLYITVS